MISDGLLVVQSGQGTLEFPMDQVDEIIVLPALHEIKISRVVPTTAESIAIGASSEKLLIRAALQEGLEPEFVRSVAMVESGLHQSAVSPRGAMGLMQLMPFTAGKLGVDPKIADQNALGGAVFLRQLLIRYNGDSALALAAYNAGPGAVDRYKGVPPYLETRQYVLKVLQEYARQQRIETNRSPTRKTDQPGSTGPPNIESAVDSVR